jgi:hypothetical protein
VIMISNCISIPAINHIVIVCVTVIERDDFPDFPWGVLYRGLIVITIRPSKLPIVVIAIDKEVNP